MNGYKALSVQEIVSTLRAYADDFGDHVTAETIERSLQKDLDSGHAQLVVEEYCIAIVRPERWKADRTSSVLWLLFVHPDERGSGIGEKFVRSLVMQFERDYPMELLCNGKRRVNFFEKCGFEFIKSLGGSSILMRSPR